MPEIQLSGESYFQYLRDMKTIPAISCVLALALWGCGSRGPVETETGEIDSLNNLAWHLQSQEQIPSDSFISMQRRAVELMRGGGKASNPVEVLTQMGLFLNVNGDYAGSLEYFQEAADSLAVRPDLAETEGAIELYGDLGRIYNQTGMYSDALEANRRGMEVSARLGGVMMSDLLRRRADTFIYLQQPDSVMACLEAAHRAVDEGKTNAGKEYLHLMVDCTMAEIIIEYPEYYSSRIPQAIGRLEEAIDTLQARGEDTNDAMFTLGKGYTMTGRVKEGINLMEMVMERWKAEEDDEGALYAMQGLMRAYSNAGEYRKLAEMFDEYDTARDTILDRQKIETIIGAEAKYRAERRKAEAEALSAKLQISRRTTAILLLAIALALSLLIIGFQYHGVVRRKRQAAEKNLALMLERQQHLNAEIERVNDELAQSRDKDVVEQVKRILNPSALTGEAEQDFRRAFASLHPHFLSELRSEFPGLTSNDELVCMLIYLGMNTDEISLSLGISRPSTNSARYRIRKKLSLPRESDLDAFLRSRHA